MKKIIAHEHSLVPMRLISLAKELEDDKPKMVMSVLKKNIPKIKKQIEELAFNEDSRSDYTDKLEQMEYAERSHPGCGFVRVEEERYEELLENEQHNFKAMAGIKEELARVENQNKQMKRELRGFSQQKVDQLKDENARLQRVDDARKNQCIQMNYKMKGFEKKIRELMG